jgi:two-component system autoinducer 2 sensor kinase/phosphatase LuxQ
MVRSIYEAGQNLHETINSLIEFAELNPEKLKLRQDHFYVEELLNEVACTVSEIHAPFTVEIEREQSSDLPEDFTLVGDLDKIKSVLLNLLGNAAKFSGASSAKLHSVVSSMDARRILWHIDVEDVGVGIDADLLDHIFAPFRHGSSTRTRVHGGAGIGLAICRGYVELMDGQISVQSRKGEGTTFSFYLSLCRGDREFSGMQLDHLADESTPPARQLSVLMVEDNASNVYYQTHLLEAFNCELTVAIDGQEALDKFRPNCFDLVLLDLHLPRISGLDVLKAIRESEARAGASNVPVIVLTADLLHSTETTCRDYGANEFIAKPVNANELKLKMAALLAQA